MASPVTIRQQNEMMNLRAFGWSYRAIADHYNVDIKTAWRHCRDVYVSPQVAPQGGRPRKVDPRRVRALHNKGMSYSALAKRFSVSETCIYRNLRAAA